MSLLSRAVELKPELIHYATSGRFATELGKVLDRFFADGPPADEAAAFLPVDYFALQHPLPGGDTVVDRFVAEHDDLDEADREMLLGWKDVVEGIFEVTKVEARAVTLFNLVDELTYRAFSNLGKGAFDSLEEGMFVVARLVPLRQDWLISATPAVHGPESGPELKAAAAHAAMANPALVFRNPEALARARELQVEQRRCFVSYFGTDLFVVHGSEVAERLRGYLVYQAERLGGRPPGEVPLPAHVTGAASVALIFDEADGLAYYADFAILEEIFADPRLLMKPRYREVLSGYLRGDAVSPVPLRRLAERDPDKASAVFARLLNRKGFQWERSGEALLRSHKPGYFAAPRLPSVTPLTAVIAEHVAA
ncbi:hypothetical protein [Nonomuraea soli]|uniref:Uncharacterized protein n=1 Tax=Nonomuraea soli TaxID=1032476 RepID=A0A7W0CQ28_9ACTN|nr:hypothetical protein [Nonomuraea soli]MBA2895185.1 hypothetical protein [Nonomuraea soli]